MAKVMLSDLDIANEVLNTKVNIDTILTILLRKKIITQQEYQQIKEEIIINSYSQYPSNEYTVK